MANSAQEQIQEQSRRIHKNIRFVERIAWGLVWVGVTAFALGIIKLFIGDVSSGTSTSSKISWSALSSLGSYFQGAVASIWSLAGLLFIYIAFLGQKHQVLQQELELLDQKRQFQLQHDSINRQNFENSFFQLLNQHNGIVTELRHPAVKDARWEGRLCFQEWYLNALRQEYEAARKRILNHAGEPEATPVPEMTHEELNQAMESLERQFAVEAYEVFYKNNQASLGHYFRNLFHIFKFVDTNRALSSHDSQIEYKERRRYTSLVRAQLSHYELALLFYNGLSSYGEEFKGLIQKYGLLEHLYDRPKILLRPVHENFYAKTAFE